jgi:hypothetical protein
MLLHPSADGVFCEHVAASGDAGVVCGYVVERNAALPMLRDSLGNDHGDNVRGQVNCARCHITL